MTYLTFGAILVLLGAGCKSKEAESAKAVDSTDLALASQATTAPQAIDELVAPIALYPDQLLGQMLIASTNSQEVLDLGNWLIQNPDLKTDAAPAAAKTAGFGTSAQYLAAFPQVVDNMCQQLDWTKQLGQAYKADPSGVMAAVQRKRSEAQQLGNLESSPQMTVASKEDNGKEVIEIAPADPKVVYVPQYNTQTIYTTPAPTTTAAAPAPTVVEKDESGVSTEAAVGIGLLSFGVGMMLGNAFDDDYYPYPSYGYGGMYYGGRPYYPPAYRAPVYAGYRPATAYRAPSNYRWNEYNRDVNVRVNNDDYYNRYRGAGTNATNATRRATTGGAASSGYLGARSTESPNQAMARANPRATTEAQRNQAARAATPGRTATPGAANARASTPGAARARTSTPTARPSPSPSATRREAGGAATQREPTRTAAAPTTRPPAQTAARTGGGDRGYATSAAGGAPQPSRAVSQRSSSSGGALGSGRSSGAQERAASSRGRSSMGAASRGGGGGGRRR